MNKLTPAEAKGLYRTAKLNGNTYRYLLALPKDGRYKATIFLCHGFPDFSFGWRYQIPLLTSLGLRVVAPDLMGYGGTDAPQAPPADIALYGFKKTSDDLAELARQLNAPKIILGGHDWGGMVVWRFAQWYPNLVTHIFTVCTPYAAPSDAYYPIEALVAGPAPQFGYQIQFASGELERHVRNKEDLDQVLKGFYGGAPAGKLFLSPQKGIDFSILGTCKKPALLDQDEMDFTVEQYSRNGMHGPSNWYKTRKANFEDEKNLKHRTMDIPALYIWASKDDILTRELSAGMEEQVPKLTRREVAAHHWALWETPGDVNKHIREWLETVVFGGKSSL